MNSALLLAAGSGSRMKGTVDDKVLVKLAGKSVIAYSVEAFLRSDCVELITVLYRDNQQLTELQRAIAGIETGNRQITWVKGGTERQDSVLQGLESQAGIDGFCFIHDSARPLIQLNNIHALLEAAQRDGAACLAHPVNDTIKRIQTPGEISKVQLEDLERNRLWAMETPQVFTHSAILQAYRKIKAENRSITDDTAAAALFGIDITLVPNPYPNPKITTASDLAYLEWLLQNKTVS